MGWTNSEARTGRAVMMAAAATFAAACSKTAETPPPADSVAMTPAPTATTAAGGETVAAAPNDQMKMVLDQLAALGGKPIETLTPTEARKQPTPADAAKEVLTKEGKTPPPMTVKSADRTITGAAGSIPARIYTPEGAGPFPVVVYYHGGGWVIANKEVYDGGARAISQMANAVVVSVDYRLAPEHKFPAAHDDAVAAYKWALANAASIKGDPMKVALAGESAGGNLAVATAIAARDQKLQQPSAVIAVYPVAQNDTMTTSYNTYANAKPLNRPMIGWFLKNTLASPDQANDPRLNLVKANLAGLPPVTIINAQIDPLQDDGAMLESALKAANVPVERKLYDGVAHEFFGMGMVVDKAKDAEQWAADRLKSAFGK